MASLPPSRSDRDGNSEIYVMNADGSRQRRLTNNSASDTKPCWSPDGNKIAFASERDGVINIYTMDADGAHQARLTINPKTDKAPCWSPDGKRIAYASDTFVSELDKRGLFEVFVMDRDGKNQRNLSNNPAPDDDPSWSPDGKKIAFVRWRILSTGLYSNIWMMNSDGGSQLQLTYVLASEGSPCWSPDGKAIAFHTNRDGNYEIYLLRISRE